MLDAETKSRIDSARQMLVGKVPDPKSQVEQITIALIYKFMDDMDAEAVEFGGKRSFFAGQYAKYGWAKLMKTGLAGHEMLALYSDAIASMPQNPGLPPLFRDIFKNAYLPYRDPETLRAFLKIINEFSYDHSERLGDAFEYLLSILGSQGDAGQFRTPRHIIDFMVEIMRPQKDEVVLDPACGTAGFLISAYKHIVQNNKDKKGNSTLTPDQKAKLVENFKGYDISPDMVRLSLVNMYLHGFSEPHIYEYDTLTSEERWNEFADVILANPPFMSPKGGIKPHKRFSIQAKRSEVLFVDYMAEHLTPNGRAAIIVPEGIIFQSQTAYKELRKMLVDNSLVAVISLPAGCFNPYSGVKTSILILDKSLAKSTDSIAFFKVENDGFGLGAQRRPIEKNDLPQVQAELTSYLQALHSNTSTDIILSLTSTAQIVPKTKLSVNGDYNLSGERYREGMERETIFPKIVLGDLLKLEFGTRITKKNDEGTLFPVYGGGGESFRTDSFTRENDVVISRFAMSPECVRVVNEKFYLLDSGFTFSIADTFIGILTKNYVAQILLNSQDRIYACARGNAQKNINIDEFKSLQIPIPPLDVQNEIVAEIEGYQKVINGARAVLDNYRPSISIDPEWPVVEVKEVCVVNPRKSEISDLGLKTVVSFVPMSDIGENTMHFTPKETRRLDEVTTSYTYFKDGDVLIAKVTPCFENGKAGIAFGLQNGIGFGSSEYYVLRPNNNVLPEWLFINVASQEFRAHATSQMTGTGGLQRVPRAVIEGYKIPLPPLTIQQSIVAEIQAEQALVAANKELVERMERKIQAVLARVWGE